MGCFKTKQKRKKTTQEEVSVPLRGVGCFGTELARELINQSISPLAGCGLFHDNESKLITPAVSISPLAGCGLFQYPHLTDYRAEWEEYQSPCGVWVVSEKIFGTSTTPSLYQSPCGVWVVSK